MSNKRLVHQALLTWFEDHRADFPWRHTRDPYAIWVSETMLQQTQVSTVLPYYERFMLRFPTVFDLAHSSLDNVLKLWAGLGYYSRARNLYRAAAMIVSEFNGDFPSSMGDLMRLPGVGRYTAGAVASLAFDADVSILDGNVMRVFTRLLDIADDISQPAVRNRLWEIATDWVPDGQAARWNEGLMELGREICTPRAPTCGSCPVGEYCLSYKQGVQQKRPVKAKKKAIPHYDVTAGIIYGADGRILIAQRPLDGMLGGLWEFPGGKKNDGERLTDCLKRELLEELGIQVEVGAKVGVVRHTYTHFKITLHAFECHYLTGEPQALGCADWRWVATEEVEHYAFPVTDQKIWKLAQSDHQPGLWD